MKYNPAFIKKHPEIWENKKTLNRYLSLIKFIPSNEEKSYYKCSVCNRQFSTELGAYNHLDVKHGKEILEAIRRKGMKKEILIDRDSLKDVIKELLEDDLAPHDPVLVWDKSNGRFSIQSNLTPMSNTEYIISDTEQGLMEDFLGDLKQDEVDQFVDTMEDDYIAEYIIGQNTLDFIDKQNEII